MKRRGKMRTAALKRKPEGVPGPVGMEVPGSGYQPGKAEQGRETDMPGLSVDGLSERFMRPFRFVEKGGQS